MNAYSANIEGKVTPYQIWVTSVLSWDPSLRKEFNLQIVTWIIVLF